MFIFWKCISAILVISILCLIGCGTDIKPNYFIGMFRDEGDIDRLSICLREVPIIEDGTVSVKSDIECLVDLSNRDISDPGLSVQFSEILNDPESYMNRILSFEATVKNLRYDDVYLYTNRHDMMFQIRSHGADVYTLDESGEEQDIRPNTKYKLKCRIVEIKINEHRVWHIVSDFIITSDKEVVYQPEVVINE